MRLRRFLARIVWNSVLAVLCVLTALLVAIVYLDDLPLAVLVLTGAGIMFAILAHRN